MDCRPAGMSPASSVYGNPPPLPLRLYQTCQQGSAPVSLGLRLWQLFRRPISAISFALRKFAPPPPPTALSFNMHGIILAGTPVPAWSSVICRRLSAWGQPCGEPQVLWQAFLLRTILRGCPGFHVPGEQGLEAFSLSPHVDKAEQFTVCENCCTTNGGQELVHVV